jgi:uncharacterized protein (DUF697 family)
MDASNEVGITSFPPGREIGFGHIDGIGGQMASLKDNPVARLGQVLSAGRDAESLRSDTVRVAIAVDPAAPAELVACVRDAFMPLEPTGLVHVASLGSSAPLEVNAATDVAVVVAGGSDSLTAPAARAFSRSGVACVVVAETSLDAPDLSEDASPDAAIALVCASSPAVLLDRLARWICDSTQKDLAFAANFPFVRKPKSEQLVRACAAENAAVGALPFLKGADLPVMTANEAKMALSIAAVYGQDLTLARVPELAGVLASAFGFRGLARGAASLLPGLSWGVGAGVGYGGAMAVGTALIARFELPLGSRADVRDAGPTSIVPVAPRTSTAASGAMPSERSAGAVHDGYVRVEGGRAVADEGASS